MKAKFCQYCGHLLSVGCDCQDEITEQKRKQHLFDFLLLDCNMSHSEERAMLEYAEHRAG